MKEHDMFLKEFGDYITSYKIKDEKIIADMASGEIRVVPWSVEAESKVLQTLESQVRLFKDYLLKLKAHKNWHAFFTTAKFFIAGGGGLWGTYLLKQNDNYGVVVLIGSGLMAFSMIGDAVKTYRDCEMIEEIEKNVFYLNKEDEFFGMKDIEMEYIKPNLSRNGKANLKIDIENGLDINKVNDYKFSDLKKIRANIDFYRAYAKNHGKTKVK